MDIDMIEIHHIERIIMRRYVEALLLPDDAPPRIVRKLQSEGPDDTVIRFAEHGQDPASFSGQYRKDVSPFGAVAFQFDTEGSEANENLSLLRGVSGDVSPHTTGDFILVGGSVGEFETDVPIAIIVKLTAERARLS